VPEYIAHFPATKTVRKISFGFNLKRDPSLRVT